MSIHPGKNKKKTAGDKLRLKNVKIYTLLFPDLYNYVIVLISALLKVPLTGRSAQSDRGAGDWKNFGAGLQYDPGCDKAVCGIDVCRKKFKDGYSGDREGDPGAVFCADAKASDRVYEGRVQPVSHGNRGELSAEEELRRLKRCRNVCSG